MGVLSFFRRWTVRPVRRMPTGTGPGKWYGGHVGMINATASPSGRFVFIWIPEAVLGTLPLTVRIRLAGECVNRGYHQEYRSQRFRFHSTPARTSERLPGDYRSGG